MKKLFPVLFAVTLLFSFGALAASPERPYSATEHGEHTTHAMSAMQGMYGAYPAAREASGTSWLPDDSKMDGVHLMGEEWTTMIHGFLNGVYDHQGGPRGDSKTFASGMLMAMSQRPLGEGTLGVRAMISPDPLMGKSGYPELLQTGETADGATRLIDRQHPHDFFNELAVSYSLPLSSERSMFVYAGLPGEPALGPPAFMHRFSAADNPEAPISHHWLDSTHIAFGVATLGYVHGNAKLEASVFRGREPDQFRYNIETGALDSASVRLSINPSRAWALQVSYGRLHSPEQLEPDINVDRTTASAIYSGTLAGGDWQATLAWGRDAPNRGATTDAYLVESAVSFRKTHTTFARLERVEKDELFPEGNPLADGAFRVNKLSAGYVYDFAKVSYGRVGVGGLVSFYSLPRDLEDVYGHPTSYMIFARWRIE